LFVQNVDGPGRHPYQFRTQVSDTVNPETPLVPAGKRVVLQQLSIAMHGQATSTNVRIVSADARGETVGSFDFEFSMGNSNDPGIKILNPPLNAYLDSGQKLVAGFGVRNGGSLVIAVFTGYVLDCTTSSPCEPIAP